MNTELPPQQLPVGTFLDLQNVGVSFGGLSRRGGYSSFIQDLPTIDNRVYGSPVFYDDNGNPEALLVTRKHLWKVASGNTLELLSEVFYANLTMEVTNAHATDDGYFLFTCQNASTFVSDGDIAAGDTVWITVYDDADKYAYEIVSVESETSVIVWIHDYTTSWSDTMLDDYNQCLVKIVAGFHRIPDWAVTKGAFVFTDNSSRGLLVYDGTSVGPYNATQTPVLTEIDTIAYFSDRLWIGSMTETGVDEWFRLRWTSVTDLETFPVSNYLDFVGQRTPLWRLLPLGNLLVAYFRDAIHYGRPTNIVNLPYDFTPYDTGNVGIVGPRAITSWLDSHWFVGQDDIYSLSATRALERIGTAVLRDTILNQDVDLEKTLVTADPENERIVFQFFSKTSGEVEYLWNYYYKTESWTREPYFGHGYHFGRMVNGLTWETSTST